MKENSHLKTQIIDKDVIIGEKDAKIQVYVNSITELKKKIKELLTVENKSELHIINYILKYYKKVPPVLAREIAKVAIEKSAEHNVSFHVIVAVMEVESNFDPFSVSKLKSDPARGLMQLDIMCGKTHLA